MASMKRDAVVKVMVPKETKEKAVAALDYWGLSLTDAVNIYLTKIIEAGGIPFDLTADKFNWDDPNIPHIKINEDGTFLMPKGWEDDDD